MNQQFCVTVVCPVSGKHCLFAKFKSAHTVLCVKYENYSI